MLSFWLEGGRGGEWSGLKLGRGAYIGLNTAKCLKKWPAYYHQVFPGIPTHFSLP